MSQHNQNQPKNPYLNQTYINGSYSHDVITKAGEYSAFSLMLYCGGISLSNLEDKLCKLLNS